MKVFIAGAGGVLGTALARVLQERGYQVVGVTRSPDKRAALESAGIDVEIIDVFDAPALAASVASFHPQVVVHALTALPAAGPVRASDLAATHRLRRVGTANLIAASIAAGVSRIIAESHIAAYGFCSNPPRQLCESDSPSRDGVPGQFDEAVAALWDLERQVLEAATALDAVVVRFGNFYGPGTGFTEYATKELPRRRLPLIGGGTAVSSWIRIEDAATGMATAIESGSSGEIYNLVDDEPVTMHDFINAMCRELRAPKPFSFPFWIGRLVAPYPAYFMSRWNSPVSNAKAKERLGWEPRFPSFREGVRLLH